MNAAHKITVDRDPQFAPCCLIVCQVNPYDHSYSTRDESRTVLIQSDWQWPALARAFGWREPPEADESQQVQEAGQFLNECLGRIVDDPGYFWQG